MPNPLRSGFSSEIDGKMIDFTSTLDIDCEMFIFDVWNTKAHVLMLKKQRIIKPDACRRILTQLDEVEKKFRRDAFEFDENLEDVHMNIEAYVLKHGGSECGAMHTGRSRNDQVVTDTRMLMREQLNETGRILAKLIESLLFLSKNHTKTVIPGYTHLQRAQPTTFGHLLDGYASTLLRDLMRLDDAYGRTNLCPLGASAFAGTNLPIDRKFTSDLLGFDDVLENSLDAVASRDFLIEITSHLAILASNLSRICEDLIIFNSNEFGIVALDDRYTTGSSIMPQKKNPDVLELIRGRTSKVYGDLVGLLTLTKGLPFTYNRDLQEDRLGAICAFDDIDACMSILADAIKTMKVTSPELNESMFATDAANFLMSRGIPFRSAYKIIASVSKKGRMGRKSINYELEKQGIKITIDEKEYKSLVDPLKCIESRKSIGSPNPSEVKRMIEKHKKELDVLQKKIGNRENKIRKAYKKTEEGVKEAIKNKKNSI